MCRTQIWCHCFYLTHIYKDISNGAYWFVSISSKCRRNSSDLHSSPFTSSNWMSHAFSNIVLTEDFSFHWAFFFIFKYCTHFVMVAASAQWNFWKFIAFSSQFFDKSRARKIFASPWTEKLKDGSICVSCSVYSRINFAEGAKINLDLKNGDFGGEIKSGHNFWPLEC